LIIDCHNHPNWRGHDLQRFLSNVAEHNIDLTWLLSWESPENELASGDVRAVSPAASANGPIPFATVVEYAERAPGKFILGYTPDPRQPGAIARLHAAIEIHGVRVCGELKIRMSYDDPDAIRLFRFCGNKGLPVVLHLQYPAAPEDDWFLRTVWYGGGIAALERALKACPDTILIGHGPGFWSHISDDDQCEAVNYPTGGVKGTGRITLMLREYPNMYCDLSGSSGFNSLKRDMKHARDFVLEFHNRLLFARDRFDGELTETLAALELPDNVLSNIYSDNALRLAPIS
jgi:predicted TIM-barrel fold metal-dependent hydrolase